MRVLKVVILCLCIISLLLPLVVAIISSNMQSYYKGQLDDHSKSAQEVKDILVKKTFWAQIGESTNFKYCYVVFAILIVLLLVIVVFKL